MRCKGYIIPAVFNRTLFDTVVGMIVAKGSADIDFVTDADRAFLNALFETVSAIQNKVILSNKVKGIMGRKRVSQALVRLKSNFIPLAFSVINPFVLMEMIKHGLVILVCDIGEHGVMGGRFLPESKVLALSYNTGDNLGKM